eukprot:SAG31_NODE_199_length_20573_cov_5.832129_11_plen_124_part_00
MTSILLAHVYNLLSDRWLGGTGRTPYKGWFLAALGSKFLAHMDEIEIEALRAQLEAACRGGAGGSLNCLEGTELARGTARQTTRQRSRSPSPGSEGEDQDRDSHRDRGHEESGSRSDRDEDVM